METGYKCLKPKRIRKRTRTRTQRARRLARKLVTKTELREALIRDAQLKSGASLTGGKLAVEVMDEEISFYDQLANTLYPWDEAGIPIKGKSVQAFYWASEMRRDYVAMRAPYQSPRLSAVAVHNSSDKDRETTVNVTILNELGDTEYTDAPDIIDDAKLIEHVASEDEEAA